MPQFSEKTLIVAQRFERLLKEIETARAELEAAQRAFEKLIRLQVTWKYKKCGKNGCRCNRGQLHGPYAYWAEYEDGKKVETYLGKHWSPPEGGVSPDVYKDVQKRLALKRQLLERLLDQLAQIEKSL